MFYFFGAEVVRAGALWRVVLVRGGCGWVCTRVGAVIVNRDSMDMLMLCSVCVGDAIYLTQPHYTFFWSQVLIHYAT